MKFSIFVLLFFCFFCESKNGEQEKKIRNISLYQFLFRTDPPTTANSIARIYYVNPLIKSGNNLNLDFVTVARISSNPTKKKLIFVHGWDITDRDSKSLPSEQDLKNRIINENWSNFIRTSLFDNIVSTKSYDIYLFDYLTSNSVDENGKRFRQRMDSLFSTETNTIVIHGHSMGGLISRFALYEGDRPAYMNRIITTGTPYHGSPWASKEFTGDKTVIGSIAGFLTDTSGGKDLAYDNFDNKLAGASNQKLTNINQKKDRDNLIYAYFSTMTQTGATDSGASSPGLSLGCPVLGSIFSTSDCIVTTTSANLSGNSLGLTRDMGRYDHLDIKLVIPSIQTLFYNDLP
jgi:hypothetical protein